MKFGILVFPGSNCDRDVAYVTRDLLGQPTRMVWHQETDISDIDVVIVPGALWGARSLLSCDAASD
jgi:phosphoribosylformylglycinamidine (FGAM) synthase-like amidotransferase family enzyme